MRLPSTSKLSFAVLAFLVIACKKDTPPAPEPPIAYTTVSTLAGNGISGFTNGPGNKAQFAGPEGLAMDAQGNIFVADNGNNCIRKITPAGVVSTYAGTGAAGLVNGPVSTAQFFGPADVAVDGQGNVLVAEYANNCIRKITPAGMVSTLAGAGTAGFADGGAAAAKFNHPNGLAVDAQGVLYVSDYDNYRIRRVMPTGDVSTVAGSGQRGASDGPAASAQFVGPEGLAVNAAGTLYVADFAGYRIRKITTAGTVSTVAGTGIRGFADGAGAGAQFNGPAGMAIDSRGDLLVADAGNACVRRIALADGTVSTVAGSRTLGFADGPVATAQFYAPLGIAAGPAGVLYLGEGSDRIRKIAAQ